MERDRYARFGGLPGRFRPCQSAANNVKFGRHRQRFNRFATGRKRLALP
jgi:hypothetical protein